MSDSHFTAPPPSDKPTKPSKPRPDFPLFAHAAGVWAKKIRGKLHYFGPWDDPEGALKKYQEQADDLHAGRKPRPDPAAVTVKEACNDFMDAKDVLLAAGELSPLTYRDYQQACEETLTAFGGGRLAADLGPDDFAALRGRLSKKWGPQRLTKTIQFVRCIFKHAFEAGLVPIPVRFGPGFKRPSKKTLRLHRAKQGPKLFTAEEIRRLMGAASAQVRAMILLGINCGFGNSDCGHLPVSAVDLDKGVIDFPRPKTGIPRRCVLWAETAAALKQVLADRPAAKKAEHANLVFVTRCGEAWYKDTPDGPLSRELGKLLRKLGINGRKGLGFYTLRHTFRTVADEARDQPAADYIMGHEVPHMSTVYREAISDARLKAVADHVHAWLFPPPKAEPKAKGKRAKKAEPVRAPAAEATAEVATSDAGPA
jgi:integrase